VGAREVGPLETDGVEVLVSGAEHGTMKNGLVGG
jgi:hypothetical protein